MARPIKFRFWRYGKMHFAHQLNAYPGNDFYGDGEILMQFANTLDKNGKDVYEGDILIAPSGNLFEVKWYDEKMRWAMSSKDTWYNNMNMGLLEVIGNIYENPELLQIKSA